MGRATRARDLLSPVQESSRCPSGWRTPSSLQPSSLGRARSPSPSSTACSRPSARGCRTGRRSRRPTSLGGSNARSATGHRSWLDHHKMMWPPGRHSVPRSPYLRCGREEDRGRKGLTPASRSVDPSRPAAISWPASHEPGRPDRRAVEVVGADHRPKGRRPVPTSHREVSRPTVSHHHGQHRRHKGHRCEQAMVADAALGKVHRLLLGVGAEPGVAGLGDRAGAVGDLELDQDG
jgi:hypothetical protein